MNETQRSERRVDRLVGRHVAHVMREAEDAVALAFAVMGNARPGGKDLWPGAWGEYRKLGATLCRIRKLRARADAWERWNTPPNAELSGPEAVLSPEGRARTTG